MVVDFIIFYLLFGDRTSTEYLHFGLSFAIYAFQTSFWRWCPLLQSQRFCLFLRGYHRSFSAVPDDFKSCGSPQQETLIVILFACIMWLQKNSPAFVIIWSGNAVPQSNPCNGHRARRSRLSIKSLKSDSDSIVSNLRLNIIKNDRDSFLKVP